MNGNVIIKICPRFETNTYKAQNANANYNVFEECRKRIETKSYKVHCNQ